jgi:4-carboxymuconolactone decarboxylase
MTRIKPITDRSELPPQRQAEWDAVFAGLGRVRGPFGVMLTSPGLAPGMLSSVQMAHTDGVVANALHELIILAVAREFDAPYQWSAHIAHARNAELSEDAIEAARTGDGGEMLEADERDVLELTRQLCRTHRLDQALFDSLVARHGERWVLLVVATAGQYQYVATFNNAFEVDPLPGDDQLPVA